MKAGFSVPTAILIGSVIIGSCILLRVDGFVSSAYAEVAGMGYGDLRRDKDFKKAVRYVVENCSVTGGEIEDGEISGMTISC